MFKLFFLVLWAMQHRCSLCPFGRAVRSGRSVGPFGPPEEEKEVEHVFFLFLREICFFLGLHGICSMSATNQYQLIWQVIFHSIRSSALWRGVKFLVRVYGSVRPRWLLAMCRRQPEDRPDAGESNTLFGNLNHNVSSNINKKKNVTNCTDGRSGGNVGVAFCFY